MGLNLEIMEGYNTIKIRKQNAVIFVRLNRPEDGNSLNNVLVKEVLDVFTEIEKDDTIKVVVIEGNDQEFCTGMDFNAVESGGSEAISEDPNAVYDLFKSMLMCAKIVISKVEGKVNAGGIGLVAASDIVIAGEKATFGLSEALFGLLPACVMPFLIRRVGVQKAQWLTLITRGISSKRAYELGLVDELSSNTEEDLRRNLLRLTRLECSVILDLKEYTSKLWIMNEITQKLAVDKITQLLNSKKVQANIMNFVKNKQFPWDKK